MGTEAIGMNVYVARTDAELTQRELAGKVGVVQSTVADWERGAYLPTLLRFVKICRSLNVSADTILNTTPTRRKK